jgi:hypothetical protein
MYGASRARKLHAIAVYWGNFGRTWVEKRLRVNATGAWQRSDVMNVRTRLPAAGSTDLPLTRAPLFVLATGVPFAEFQRAWHAAIVE